MIDRHRGFAPTQAGGDQPIDKFDGAMVAYPQPLGQFADRDLLAVGKSADRQQGLMLP